MATSKLHTVNMADRRNGFTPPPHENAEAHRVVMERMRSMSGDQFVASAVRAGIYTADGKLTDPYRSDGRNSKAK